MWAMSFASALDGTSERKRRATRSLVSRRAARDARSRAASVGTGARVGEAAVGLPSSAGLADFKRKRGEFRMKRGQATSPYCFILRQSVTVLIFSAAAA